jgi:hypothetical protein
MRVGRESVYFIVTSSTVIKDTWDAVEDDMCGYIKETRSRIQ